MQGYNNVADKIPHPGASRGTVLFLGNFTTEAECMSACASNSTPADPCRSWTFHHPQMPRWGSGCYGEHDNKWKPKHVPSKPVSCARSCKYPPNPGAPTPGPGPGPGPAPARLTYNPWCDNVTCVPGPPPPNMSVPAAIAAAVDALAAAGPPPLEHVQDESAGDIYGAPWWTI